MKAVMFALGMICLMVQGLEAATIFTTPCTQTPCPSVEWDVDFSGMMAQFTIRGAAGNWTSMAFTDEQMMKGGKVVFDCIDAEPAVIMQTSTNAKATQYGNMVTPDNDKMMMNKSALKNAHLISCTFTTAVGSKPQYIIMATGKTDSMNVKQYHGPMDRWISSQMYVPNRGTIL